MTQSIRDKAGADEAAQKKALSYLFQQDSTGLATDGVLAGLAVSQTTTASADVVVGAGSGVVQSSVLLGVSQLVNDTDYTLDVLTANPVGGLPRNDIVVFDSATVAADTGGIRVVVGTPNAIPTDPTVPSSAIPLARLRHAASATTVPAAKIDDLRTFTKLAEASVGTDTGWLDLPIVPGGWTVPSGQVRWQARRRGGLVHFRGALVNATYGGSGAILATICTLPASIPNPPSVTTALSFASNTSNNRWVWVQTDGTVQAYTSGASSAWFIIGGSYTVD